MPENKKSLDDLLQEISVDAPGMWENSDGPEGWFAVTTPNEGIVAYFWREADAYRYRLGLINRIMNP